MTKSYTKVASFPSSSNPSKTYTVSKDEEGALSCDCPAWKFKKGEGSRTCKHVQAVEQGPSERWSPLPTAASLRMSEEIERGRQTSGAPVSDLLKKL